jgi:thioredoxin 1
MISQTFFRSVEEFKVFLSKEKACFVFFTASWAGPCQHLKPAIHSMAEKYTTVKFILVDVDDSVDMAEEAGIEQIPRCQVYESGRLVGDFLGGNPTAIESMLKEAFNLK